jgi:hypothetical protein
MRCTIRPIGDSQSAAEVKLQQVFGVPKRPTTILWGQLKNLFRNGQDAPGSTSTGVVEAASPIGSTPTGIGAIDPIGDGSLLDLRNR